MAKISRRTFLKSLGTTAAITAFPAVISAQSKQPKVIVVGGGFAGATAAKYLRHWDNNLNVTLVEPRLYYRSPILSNLVLTNQISLSSLSFNYDQLSQKYGVNVIRKWVRRINSQTHQLILQGGIKLEYDRLILAPGISFDAIDGLDSSKVPHGWTSGANLLLLKRQLRAMPRGGSFVMTIPKAPYRCPPGPYERACMIADYLRRNKPGATITVLDANAGIVAEKHTFETAFNGTYADILSYRPNTTVLSVDSDQRSVHTNLGDFDADVLNVIPTHRAGSLIHSSGLANSADGRWAEVNPLSYESTKTSAIHIIGDSQGTGQPKAGHIANAEAKVCADAVIRLLGGLTPYQAPMTNSACFSPISSNTASWLTAVFSYDASSGTMKAVPGSGGEANSPTRENYTDMFDWAHSLFGDTFA